MALCITAAQNCISFQDPLSVSGHYFNKGLENIKADIEVRVLNTSRSTASVEISITQENILRCKFLGTFGILERIKGLTKVNDSCPVLPPPESCVNASRMIRKLYGDQLKLSRSIDMKFPKTDPFNLSTMKGKIGKFYFFITFFNIF